MAPIAVSSNAPVEAGTWQDRREVFAELTDALLHPETNPSSTYLINQIMR